MKRILFIFLALILMGCSTLDKKSESNEIGENKMKKISILDTNNGTYAYQNINHIYQLPDVAYLSKLKKYVQKKGLNSNSDNEFIIIKKSLKWVSSQWRHDGMNQPPKHYKALDILKSVHQTSARYRCVEYGKVLADVLQSFGFITRTVGLRSKDVAYGAFGQGHVAMEVWLNDLDKWVFFDPQFGSYLTNEGLPLNIYDLYKLKKAKKWKQVEVSFIKKSKDNSSKDYKDFLGNYLGHMSVMGGGSKVGIALELEDKKHTITFQGLEQSNILFTDNHKEIYPEVNRVSIILDFKNKTKNFVELIKKLKIKTDKDYLNNMSEFAAIPEFKVKLITNMPLFSYYEYRLKKNSTWKKVDKDSFAWDAKNKTNLLEVRAVNKLERPGPITYIELAYQ